MKTGRLSLIALLLIACVMAANAASARVLRFAEFGPNRGVRAEALQWFADEVERRSGGELSIQFFWGGSLLGTRAVLQGVATGVADMGSIVGFLTPQELKAYNIGDLPLDNADPWVGMRALYELSTTHPALDQEFSDAGVVYLTNYTTGPIQLICTRPVNGVEQLQGLNVRASGPYGKALADLGANVQRMSQPKVYQALDSGLVDCNQNYYYSIMAYRQYEVAPYVVELDWGQNMSFGIVMNARVFNSLTPEQQDVVRSVSDDFIDHFAHVMLESRAKAKQAMTNGIDGTTVEITQWPPEDRARLIEAGRKYIREWAEEANAARLDGEAILDTYRGLIEKYTQARESRGYPWSR